MDDRNFFIQQTWPGPNKPFDIKDINENFRKINEKMINYRSVTPTIIDEHNKVFLEDFARIRKTLTPTIKKVIFNDPATIVFWSDGTKTVVKKQKKDKKKKFDKEKGLAMAISKKFLGNKGNYCNEFKKWCE